MQIQVVNDFNTDGPFNQAAINSFLADEQTAVNILDATFTDNISVTFDVGFGSYRGQIMGNQQISEADVNSAAVFPLTYSQLRQDLLTFGQPGFFNAANLPAGASINGVSNFWVSSSVGACFGLFTQATDGFVGIGTGFQAGAVRVSAFLHEMGHAMGRVPEIINGADSALDLVRFVSQGNRLFDGTNPDHTFSYFSIDGGATQIAQWGQNSDSSDFLNGQPFANDPFNENVGDLGQLTTADIECMEALGFKTTPPGNPAPPPGTTADMILRHGADGLCEIYDIGGNSLLAAYQLGQVGTDWKFAGLGGFFGNDTTDLLLRNSTTGGLEVYDINNNQLTGAAFIGTVGLDWQFAGIAPANGAGTSDLVLRNVNSGAFEVYDIANNQLMGAAALGAVGTDWQLGGFAADPPTGAMGGSGGPLDLTSQLVQAMASFGGGGAANGLNIAALGSDTSQQPLLTTPQHA